MLINPMPARDRQTSAKEALRRKRRLHPLAIVMPFSSYSRPPRLASGKGVSGKSGLPILFAVLVVIDLFTNVVTVTSDGGILIHKADLSLQDMVGSGIVLGLLIIALVVRWWRFRWWVEDDAIWTSGGILNRWRRRVGLAQIAAIDRSTSPVRRIFRVSRIQIETTAVDQVTPDILFGYLSKREADRLEEWLTIELMGASEGDESNPFEARSIGRLGWWDLFLAGAMTFQFGRAVVVLYGVYQFFQDETTPTVSIDTSNTSFGLQSALVQFGGITVGLWLMSTLYFVASFARYRIGKHGGWLIIETGVIRPMRRFIRIDAIQGIELYRSPLQRRIRRKRAMLRMRLPAYGTPSVYAMVLHPAVTDAMLPALTQQLVGMDPATTGAVCGQGIQRVAVGCRGAYVFYWPIRMAALSVALVLLLLMLQPNLWWLALAPLVLAVPLGLVGWRQWASTGWYANQGDWLVIQRGAFGLTSTAARVEGIEYLTWTSPLRSSQNPNLSMTISVSTSAGGGVVHRILALLGRPVNPAIIRIRAMPVADARRFATATGLERSLPPEPIAE